MGVIIDIIDLGYPETTLGSIVTNQPLSTRENLIGLKRTADRSLCSLVLNGLIY